jgi:hypothetical protein
MKSILILAITLCIYIHSSHSASTLMCSTQASSSAAAYYCTIADNTSTTSCSQCAAGVKHFCPTNPPKPTSAWIRGTKVIGNCGSIAPYTAIATFGASNGGYYGHAAVFIRCSGTTIDVYDQWDGKKWGFRSIWDTNGAISNNPNGFYTITV